MADDMGVTGNAILLLGYLGGVVGRPELQSEYEFAAVEPGEGWMVLKNRRSGNSFRVSVSQIGGTE